jgi:hypothetical protein
MTGHSHVLPRVHGEFAETPDLCLAVAQASRLWNTDSATSVALLDALVDPRFRPLHHRQYGRIDVDEATMPDVSETKVE